jgi:alpha-glucosidase
MLPPALWRFLYIIVLFTFLPTSSAQIKIKIKNTQNLQYTQTPTSVQIYWQDKLVFELPKTQLLTAIRQQTKIKHKMGSFKFKQHTQKKCTQSVIQTVKNTTPNEVQINGFFEDNKHLQFQINFSITNNSTHLNWHITTNDSSYNCLQFTYLSSPTEHFFGGGIQLSHFDLKGHKVPIWTEEDGIGRGDRPTSALTRLVGAAGNSFTTHAAIPYFQTTQNRSFWLDTNGAYSVLDFTKNQKITLEVWQNTLSGMAWLGNNPLDLVEQYTAFSGRFETLPTWAYGFWLGAQGGRTRTEQLLANLSAQNIYPSVLWIQDWEGKRKTKFGSQLQWNWQADTLAYPQFSQFCTQLNQKGIKVLGYINPFLTTNTALCDTALSRHYVVHNAQNQPYAIATTTRKAYLIDLSNPAACTWYKSIIKHNLIEAGLSGWMADYAEWLPTDAKLFSGEDAALYHNRYATDWAKLNRQAIDEAGETGKIVFFNRAGYSYANKYSTLFWLGDQLTDWGKNDGIHAALTGMLSGGISGIALNHSDIGGYTNLRLPFLKRQRSPELLYRWLEMNIFMPILRTHEGLIPQHNAQIYTNTATMQFAKPLLDIHKRLQPYFEQLSTQANQQGYPIVRPLYLHYPTDTVTYNLQNQFLLGKDMLIAPVLTPNTQSVKIYFPEGEWIHITTKQIVKGKCWQTVPAPLGQPAAYIQRGSSCEQLIFAY